MSTQATKPRGTGSRPGSRRTKAKDERGASAVEFAIVMSILLMFVFGTIQFGIAYNRDQGLKHAAREGARIAAVGGTEDEVAARVRAAQSLFQPLDIDIKIAYSADGGANYTGLCDDATGNPHDCNTSAGPCGTAGIGSLVRVTATVPGSLGKYAIVIPMWGNAKITFNAQGVFRCENKT